MSLVQNMTTSNQQIFAGKLVSYLGCFFVFFMLSGCQTTNVESWKPVRNEQKNQVHTVTWDSETLPVIAKWYTGAEKNWKDIANANPNIVPSQLSPGDRVLIPPYLVKTRATMTKSFFDEWRQVGKHKETPAMTGGKRQTAPLLVPKLHKLKQDGGVAEHDTPLDLKEPEDDGDDLELFGPK